MLTKGISTSPEHPADAHAAARRKPIRPRRKINRRSVPASEIVMIALDNPNGLRWVMEFAPVYASILNGISAGLEARNTHMQVCSIRSAGEFESLVQGRPPDGLLFLASKNVVQLKGLIGTIPCVAVLGNACEGHFDQVTYDHESTGRLPAECFLQRGIKRAAILGPTEPGRRTTFGLRLSSFCEAMQEAGGEAVPFLSDALYEKGNPSNQPRSSEIERLIQQLKQTRPLPEALFVMADNMVPAVYQHLTAAGLNPGKDIQIISCNSESSYFSGLTNPPSSVEIPGDEIGRRAVELLAWRAENPQRPTATTILYPELNLRS